MIRQFWFCVATCCNIMIAAQNNFTFSNDIYSGINSAVLSPTHTFINPNPWDINLASADVLFHNNYGYISQQSVLGLSHADIVVATPQKNITGESQPNVLDFYNKKSTSYGLFTDILGPSFSISANINKKKFVLGAFTRSRVQSSFEDFDNYFRFGNDMMKQPPIYEMEPFSGKVMSWNELGFNAATAIFPYSEKQWIIGFNLKYEMGMDAVNIVSHQHIKLTASDPPFNPFQDPSKMDIYASNYDLSLHYITNYNFEKKRYEYRQNGSGLGLDFGITMLDKDPNEEQYNYLLSLNMLDLGYINFNKGINHSFANGNKIWLQNNPELQNKRFESPEQFLRLLSKEAYGDENRSFVDNGFKIGLPTSININYSQRIKENQFLNVNYVQRLPIFENSMKKNNIINVNYSVQKAALGYGLSTSLSEYKDINFGGYLRWGPLIIGSENLLPLLFKHQKLHAAAFYMAIKLYPFWDNEMKRHRRQKCGC